MRIARAGTRVRFRPVRAALGAGGERPSRRTHAASAVETIANLSRVLGVPESVPEPSPDREAADRQASPAAPATEAERPAVRERGLGLKLLVPRPWPLFAEAVNARAAIAGHTAGPLVFLLTGENLYTQLWDHAARTGLSVLALSAVVVFVSALAWERYDPEAIPEQVEVGFGQFVMLSWVAIAVQLALLGPPPA